MIPKVLLRAVVLLTTALLGGASAAPTYPTVQIATYPAAPVPGDPLFIKLSGTWTDGCVPETSARVTVARSGSIYLVDLSYVGFQGGCTAALTPWALDVQLEPLAAGSYAVEVARTDDKGAKTIGSGTFSVAPPATATLWVPGFHAITSSGTLSSTLTLSNGWSEPVVVTPVAAYDALGEWKPSTQPVPIAAGASSAVATWIMRPGQAVQMVELRAPSRVVFRATLERIETIPDQLPVIPGHFGRVELPLFTDLFPARLTTAAGDLSFTMEECNPYFPNQRRVNLTVFNAGRAAGNVLVTALSLAGPVPGWKLSYQVPARSTVQFNALPVEGLPICGSGQVWLRITVDQPYLAYVSTVRPDAFVPGILPYEIFQARFER